MFISQGPPGSLQAHTQAHRHVHARTERKIYAVSLVTFIRWEVPCSFFFSPIHFQQRGRTWLCVCMLVRGSVCMCVCAVFQPRGHASGVGSRYICHCLRRVASIFRRTRLALALKDRLVLSLPSVSVAPFSSSSSSPAISASASPRHFVSRPLRLFSSQRLLFHSKPKASRCGVTGRKSQVETFRSFISH